MDTNSLYIPLELLETKKKMLAGYYAHITALDEQLGRLIVQLKDKGIYEDTMIVFAADHGDMLGNQDAWYKSQPWRESVGIPLIMSHPGVIPEKRITNGPISLIELMPSILSLTGTPIPEDAEGNDLSEFILGNEEAAPDSVFINFSPNVHIIPQPPFRGVVTRTHTYAETKEDPWLLYDDGTDFFQKNNLIFWANRDDTDICTLQEQMHAKLTYWLERTNDNFEDGDTINNTYQPGHVGGVLPHKQNHEFNTWYAEIKRKKDAEKQ